MKKVFLLLSVAILAFSCDDATEEVTPDSDSSTEQGTENNEDNNEENGSTTTPDTDSYATLTFEDADYAASTNYLGYQDWSSLIDSEEYGGELLYNFIDENDPYTGYSEYAWYDENNTELASEVVNAWGSAAYWNGGIAVSNYYLEVVSGTEISYYNQLSVPCIDENGMSGYDGSANFAVVNASVDLYFADLEPRQIMSMQVAATSYWMSVAIDGNYDSAALGEGDYFKIIATADTAESVEFYLAQDGQIVEGWNEWDLSSLGLVSSITFSVDSSVVNDWGVSLPTNFAIDNIVVQM